MALPDPTPLTEEELIASALAWNERLSDDNKTEANEAIWDESWDAAKTFYSERERALREAAIEMVAAMEGLVAYNGAEGNRRFYRARDGLRAALEPTDPAPSTTEGAERDEPNEADLPDADTAAAEYEETKRRVIAGTASVREAQGFIDFLECAIPTQPRPTTEGVGGDESCGSTLEHTIRCTKSSGHEPPHSHVSGEGTAHWTDDDPRGRASEGARDRLSLSLGEVLEGAREGERIDPIKHAKQECDREGCGHVRHGHNQIGGACNQCACPSFQEPRAPEQLLDEARGEEVRRSVALCIADALDNTGLNDRTLRSNAREVLVEAAKRIALGDPITQEWEKDWLERVLAAGWNLGPAASPNPMDGEPS